MKKIERIDSIHKEKKQNNHQYYQQKQQQQHKKESQPKTDSQNQQSKPNKHKLINKTQFYDEIEALQQTNQTPKPKIQILSRNASKNEMKPQTTITNTNLGPLSSSPYKNAVLNQISQKQVSKPVSINKNCSFSSTSTPSVPASTTELAPAASLLPIPFGLSPQSSQDHQNQSRNVLLNMLAANNNQNKSIQSRDPLSLLINGQVPTAKSDDLKFVRLNKINKLRDVLRSSQFIPVNDNFDIIDYFDQICLTNNIDLKYVQYQQADSLYYGELFIESFRLVSETHKKRKKCKYYAYKNALEILKSRSELAVKLASSSLASTKNSSNPSQMIKLEPNDNISFEYELYRLDSGQDLNINSSNSNNSTLNIGNIKSGLIDPNLVDLNAMLKSMILPKDNTNINSMTTESQNNDDSKESQIDIDDDNDDDEEDYNKTHNLNKKTRIKQNLINFCLFIPSNSSSDPNEQIDLSNLDQYVHDRNSLQILNQSCVKSMYNLEFELKIKQSNTGKSTKTIISGDRIQTESEDEMSSSDMKKYKCKCLINGLKIASAHAYNKTDAKRLAALKAIKYLFKLFPAIKETSYQTINSISSINSSVAPTPKYFKITKEELFGGLLPPTLFETPLNSLASNDYNNSPSLNTSQLGEKLLKKMGWRGEGYGLGKLNQGITKPIDIQDTSRTRLGFGFSYHFCDGYDEELSELDRLDTLNDIASIDLNDEEKKETNKIHVNNKFNPKNKFKINEFLKNIRNLLNNFVSSQTERDLVFDKSLSIDERKLIHREAHRYGLKTRSEGTGEDRFLVVRRKQTSNEILESVIKNGGEINKYKIISRGDL